MEPGSKFKFTLENSRPTWDIKLMSYILDPLPGAKLKAGPVSISGVAYNDGKPTIEAVLVSVDKGKSWTPTEFDVPERVPIAGTSGRPRRRLGPVPTRSGRGATDLLGRSQPLDGKIFWKPNGYEWTGIFKNEVTVQ